MVQTLFPILIFVSIFNFCFRAYPLTCHEVFSLEDTKFSNPVSSNINKLESPHISQKMYDDYLVNAFKLFRFSSRRCESCAFDIDTIVTHLNLKNLQPHGNALLAGDIPGSALAKYLSARNSQTQIYTLDLSNRGQKQFDVEGTVTAMPFESNSFDFVFSHMVMHYLRAMSEFSSSHPYGADYNMQHLFVSEVIRVLKPGGEARIGILNNWEAKQLQRQFPKVSLESVNSPEFEGDLVYLLVIKKPKETHSEPYKSEKVEW